MADVEATALMDMAKARDAHARELAAVEAQVRVRIERTRHALSLTPRLPNGLHACMQVTAATERATAAEATVTTLQAQVKKQETTINELNAKLAQLEALN